MPPRIRPLDEHEVPDDVRTWYEADRARFGKVLNSTGIYAYAPQWLGVSRQFGPAGERSGHVPSALQSLVNLFVARQVGCPS